MIHSKIFFLSSASKPGPITFFLSFVSWSAAILGCLSCFAPACKAAFTSSAIHREIIVLDNAKKKIQAGMAAGRGYSQDDYRRYVAYLERRIEELCATAVNEYGPASVASLPCPPISAFLPGYQVPRSSGSAERIGSADRELLESLGSFDEFLAEEQKRVMADRPESEGSAPGEAASSAGGAGTGGAGGRASGAQGGGFQGANGGMQAAGEASHDATMRQGEEGHEAGRIGHAGSESGSGSRGVSERAVGGEASSQRGQQGSVGISGEGGGGSPVSQEGGTIYEDDDIVARQLREAAEREKDPELKKKLWEEYRKYKEANRR